MGGVRTTGNKVHDNNCYVAENTLRQAISPASTQAQVNAAEIAYYKTIRDSEVANGLSEAGAYNAVIKGLGGQP
jgi:hypothetical protein